MLGQHRHQLVQPRYIVSHFQTGQGIRQRQATQLRQGASQLGKIGLLRPQLAGMRAEMSARLVAGSGFRFGMGLVTQIFGTKLATRRTRPGRGIRRKSDGLGDPIRNPANEMIQPATGIIHIWHPHDGLRNLALPGLQYLIQIHGCNTFIKNQSIPLYEWPCTASWANRRGC